MNSTISPAMAATFARIKAGSSPLYRDILRCTTLAFPVMRPRRRLVWAALMYHRISMVGGWLLGYTFNETIRYSYAAPRKAPKSTDEQKVAAVIKFVQGHTRPSTITLWERRLADAGLR